MGALLKVLRLPTINFSSPKDVILRNKKLLAISSLVCLLLVILVAVVTALTLALTSGQGDAASGQSDRRRRR